MNYSIDINFDFRTETRPGSDPDKYSSTLRNYHKALWCKPLPNGEIFNLIDTYPKEYLLHKSSFGEFKLSSDAITHSYKNTKRMAHIIEKIPSEKVESLCGLGATIGSYILFPKNIEKNQQSINQVRGCNHKIADRFDLTLECIRLLYIEKESPLTSVLKRHSDFFSLFENFKGYVDFFLLQDLVTKDYAAINFHLNHQSFEVNPFPQNIDQYLEYREKTMNFIKARSKRMLWALDNSLR